MANIIGVVLLLVGLYYLAGARRLVRRQGTIMFPTVSQYNILPFLIGIALLTTASFLWLLVGLVAFVAAPMFAGRGSVFTLPFFIAAVLGMHIAAQQGWSLIGGAVVALIAMMILGSIVFAVVDIG